MCAVAVCWLLLSLQLGTRDCFLHRRSGGFIVIEKLVQYLLHVPMQAL